MRTDDGCIVQECLNGEPGAFGILVDKYKAGVYAFVYDKLRDFQDAQDITQEVFLQAYSNLHSLRRYESFGFWLYRIARNQCGKWIRASSKRPDSAFIEDQDPAVLEEPSLNAYHSNQMEESLREALESLSETHREVLMLHYFGGMSIKNIAGAIGASPTAIGTRLSRARAQLREEMLAMMDTAFEEQRLQASFTLRVVEAVKRIKINPVPRMAGLPLGLSLAMGIIITVLSLNPHISTTSDIVIPTSSPLFVEAKALETGEIPVDILKTSNISIIASKLKDGDAGDPQNAVMLAPQQDGAGKWTQKANMPTSRNRHSSCVVDGKIYVIGGIGGFWWNVAPVEVYDPMMDTWTKKTDMPAPKHGFAMCVMDGIIYVFGGEDLVRTTSTVHAYDPVTDEWEKKADMPTARSYAAASAVDGKIYVIGGGWPVGFSTVEEYDPVTDTWVKKADMPATAEWSTSVVDGKIYAIGGSPANGYRVEVYDPAIDKWEKKADMPTPRVNLSSSVVGGKIYAIGGTDAMWGVSAVEVYDPVTDTWTKENDMPTARGMLSTSAVNGKIYAIGGGTGGGNCAPLKEGIVEEYDPGVESQGSHVSAEEKLPTTWGEVKSD
ncbi:sigma-70 family RNA polymerase sigma factor [Candidatus Poribacteria bacterium]